jgi:hypothetical protein
VRYIGVLVALSFALLVAVPAHAITVTTTNDATVLANTILGPGITLVGPPTYIGAATASGTFTGGTASGLGFDTGIVLTSGLASSAGVANTASSESLSSNSLSGADNASTNTTAAGDAQLNLIVAPQVTEDASVLQFGFQFGDGTAGGDVFFNYVFASEEYINFVNSDFNDVFALFIDGVNVALIPGTSTPVSINNVNPTAGDHPELYRNNVNNPDGFPNLGIGTAYDGLTTVLTAEALGLGPGVHTMKFAVADTADGVLDSAVFVQGGTFSSQPPGPGPIGVPAPATLILLGMGLIGLGRTVLRRRTQD